MTEAESEEASHDDEENPLTESPSSTEEVSDEKMGCEACQVPESEMLDVYDRGMDKPWKGGNPYARICPECGSRTFAPKSYWESQDVKYVIPADEDDNEPKPMYQCPYEDCGETFLGMPDECPHCEQPLQWEDGDDTE